MNYIDTHAHLYDPAFDTDRREVIQRSIEAGVNKILLPDVDSQSRAQMNAMADEFRGICFPMVGLHPTSVNEFPERWQEEVEMVRHELTANHKRYIAVGEIGMDLYWSQDFEAQQREAFTAQLDMSLEFDLPVAIHVRDAWESTIAILEGYKGRGLRGVIHAYSGDVEAYKTIKGFGDFLFAIGGVVTFKKSKLAEVAREIPLKDLLLETDAPYLTPTPHRGKRNESSYIPLIGDFIAQLKGVSAEEVATITTANAMRLFGIGNDE
ncbi:MAG: TatD family hydrolase [Rikenellaceae bacterium]